MENVCRTCLRSSLTLRSLIGNTEIIEKIEAIAPIKIRLENNLPAEICEECIGNVNKLYNFRKVIINSDLELKERSEVLKITDAVPHILDFPAVEENTKTERDILLPIVKLEVEDESVEINSLEISTLQLKPSFQNTEKPTVSYNVLLPAETNRSKRQFFCSDCNFISEDITQLKAHRRITHCTTGVCSICGKTMRKDNLSKHIKNHTSNFTCNQCGQTFKNYDSLRSHTYQHRGEQLPCEVCGKLFYYHGDLNRHVKRHVMKKVQIRMNCTVCNKNLEKRAMKKHMRSHTGERPYICEYCRKGFSSSHALKTHIRQHTKEKPYVCEHCPMAFPQKVSLITHIKSKHKTKKEPAN